MKSSFRARRVVVCFPLIIVPAMVASLLAWVPPASAQTDPKNLSPKDATNASAASAINGDADRILNMRRLLESDRRQKEKLEAELEALEEEFEEAAGEFERLDSDLTAAQARLDANTDPAQQARLQDMVKRLTTGRATKRTRFEMVIDRRKAIQQQLATLSEKLALEKEYLERLSSNPALPAGDAPSPGPDGARPAEPAPASGGTTIIPGLPAFPSSKPQTDSIAADPDQLDEGLRAARKERQAKVAALREAEARVKRLERAIDVFERDLVSSRELLTLANRSAMEEEETLATLTANLEERRKNGEMEEDLAWLVAERDESRVRTESAHEEVAMQTGRISKSEATLQRLKKSRDEAVKSVVDGEASVRDADRKVWFLSSPIAPYQLSRWFTNKAPRVVFTVVGAFALYWLTKRVAGRLLGKVLQKSGRGNSAEREGRAETLRRVFDSTAGVVIVVMGILTALNQAGVNVTVLLGGAAVIGAALAFGSQNLIKDYFSGFMILMENQYSVGNVVKVGQITGTVENITLRMTSLRDLEGVLHFVPHSQVLSVSNLTYGWSRIVMDIKVSVNEDADKVMGLILQVARELKQDRDFGPQILGEPDMLGVDSIGGSAMVIKVLVKTKPLNRWPVKREMLRRIKRQFDESGVKMA